MVLSLLILAQAALTLPLNTAYFTGPDAKEGGSLGAWTHATTEVLWGGYISQPGILDVKLELEPSMDRNSYNLAVNEQRRVGTNQSGVVDFGQIDVRNPGWYTFKIHGDRLVGQTYGAIDGLSLDGSAVPGSKFNLKERRNSASVHLLYASKPEDRIEWFYNEVRPHKDPIYTYYMACGFHRGYFGIQVNGPAERRIIFSVWDAGNEAVDRNKVNDANRVQLLAKGEGVDAGSFGNEGTGGHSHLVYDWKTNQVQRFLLHCVPSGDTTDYTAYYYFNDRKKWGLIASFRAPKDGQWMHGLYSFIEDFGGENGQLLRQAEFGPVWVKSSGGPWRNIDEAKFSHDGTGGKDRFDYDAKAVGTGFLLQNGGFEGSSPAYGMQMLTHPATILPKVDLDSLPNS